MVVLQIFIKKIHDFHYFTKIKIIALVSLFLHHSHFVNSVTSEKMKAIALVSFIFQHSHPIILIFLQN